MTHRFPGKSVRFSFGLGFILAGTLFAGCNGSGAGADMRAKGDAGNQDGGATGPLWGGISLSQTQLMVGAFTADQWSASAVLRDPPSGLVTSQKSIAGCTVTITSGTEMLGKSLDAGNLTISGGLAGPLVFQFDPNLGVYGLYQPNGTDAAPTPDLGALFDQTSVLTLSAAGGPGLKMLSATWQGVTPLALSSPTTLSALPTGADLPIAWVAATQAGVAIQVTLASANGTMNAACQAPDSGSYSLPQAVIAEFADGPITLSVSRAYAAQARSERGPLPVQSQSTWIINTSKGTPQN
jgi:hypothetical protein